MLPLCPLDAGSTRSRPRLELCQHASPPPLVGLYILIPIKKTHRAKTNLQGVVSFLEGVPFFPFFIFYFFTYLFIFIFFIFSFFLFLFFYFLFFYYFFIFFIFYFLFFCFLFFLFFIFLIFIFFSMTSSLAPPTPPSFFLAFPHPPLSAFFPLCLADPSPTLADAFRRFSEDFPKMTSSSSNWVDMVP